MKRLLFFLFLLPLVSPGQTAHWALDDNAASATVIDDVGSHNGSLYYADGTTSYSVNTEDNSVAGIKGGALEFLNASRYDNSIGIQVPDDDSFSFGDGSDDRPFSLSCWVYMNNWGALSGSSRFSFLMSKRFMVTGGHEWQFDTNYDSTTNTLLLTIILFDQGNNSSNIRCNAYPDYSSFLHRWHFIVATYDALNYENGITLYIDGVDVSDTKSMTGTYVAMSNTSSPMSIGAWYRGTDYNIFSVDGEMDDVYVWDRVLTPENVHELFYGANIFLWSNF